MPSPAVAGAVAVAGEVAVAVATATVQGRRVYVCCFIVVVVVMAGLSQSQRLGYVGELPTSGMTKRSL